MTCNSKKKTTLKFRSYKLREKILCYLITLWMKLLVLNYYNTRKIKIMNLISQFELNLYSFTLVKKCSFYNFSAILFLFFLYIT